MVKIKKQVFKKIFVMLIAIIICVAYMPLFSINSFAVGEYFTITLTSGSSPSKNRNFAFKLNNVGDNHNEKIRIVVVNNSSYPGEVSLKKFTVDSASPLADKIKLYVTDSSLNSEVQIDPLAASQPSPSLHTASPGSNNYFEMRLEVRNLNNAHQDQQLACDLQLTITKQNQTSNPDDGTNNNGGSGNNGDSTGNNGNNNGGSGNNGSGSGSSEPGGSSSNTGGSNSNGSDNSNNNTSGGNADNAWNPDNKPAIGTDPEGRPIYEYDKDGKPIIGYDKEKRPIYDFDKDGRPIIGYDKKKQPIFDYDANGKPIIAYDKQNRPIIGYDKKGNPIFGSDKANNGIEKSDTKDGKRTLTDKLGFWIIPILILLLIIAFFWFIIAKRRRKEDEEEEN